MSVEFRQRTLGEYAEMLWRRKWLIALPAVAVTLAVTWVVWRLPNTYESRTLLTVRPPGISSSVVPQLSDSDLSIRINNISQEVTSNSTLKPMIERYNLYAAERNRGEPMDVLVERMRTKDISIQINTSRDVTNGFILSFRGPDPRATKAVTEELASKYTSAQTDAAMKGAMGTKEFFEQKLRQAKEELEAIDLQRLRVMEANKSSLPQSTQALIGQLAGLREEQKSVMTTLGLLRERRSSLNTQRADLEKQRAQEIENIVEAVGDPKQTPNYIELAKRKRQFESERQQLRTQFRDKHPDIIAKQTEINSVQEEIDEIFAETKSKIAERRKKLESQIDPRLNSIKYELQSVDAQANALEKRLATNEGQIGQIERRLNDVPTTEVALEKVNRDYETAKANYDSLLTQEQKADIIASVNATAQGEAIAVIDPAFLPERPIAPNRPMLIALGFFAGLACGLLFAALFEVPRLLKIQTTEDAEHYTGLPVLVTLPTLLTPREERGLKLRRAAFVAAGLLLTVLSVPALAFALRFTRVIEMFASKG
jgi:polysaccharide chain length determinant protein (PEP-CTERM system associated)